MARTFFSRDTIRTTAFVVILVVLLQLDRVASGLSSLASIFPATGFTMGVLLLSPRTQWRRWILLCFGFAVANAYLRLQIPFFVVAGVVAVAMVQCWLTAALVLRFSGGKVSFGRVREVVALVLVAAVVNAICTVVAGGMIAGHWPDLMQYMRTRWVSHGLSALILTPLMVTWGQLNWRQLRTSRARCAELILTALGTVATIAVALSAPARFTPLLPAPYLVLAPIIVTAIRFGPAGVTLALAVLTGFVITAVSRGAAWPVAADSVSRLAIAELFLAVVSVTGLLLAAGLREKETASREVQESEGRFRAMFQNSTNAISVAHAGRIQMANPAFLNLFGVAQEAAVRGEALATFVPALSETEIERLHRRGIMNARQAEPLEFEARRTDGSRFPVQVNLDQFNYESAPYVLLVCVDLTERRRAQRELERLNRTLRTLSRASHEITHAANEAQLLKAICPVVVEDGRFLLCWIGHVLKDEGKTVQPISAAGEARDYVESLRITWADEPNGRGPTGTAIRSGQPCICQNFDEDEAVQPWRATARSYGIQSAITFPLRIRGEVAAVLTIYSGDANAFDPDERALLEEMAHDLEFAIGSLRERAEREQAEAEVRRLLAEAEQVRLTLLRLLGERRQAEEALERSEVRYRSAMHDSAIGMALVAPDGRWLDVNPMLCEIVGYSREELLARTFSSLTHPDDRGPDLQMAEAALAGHRSRFELQKRYLHKSGREVWVHLTISLLRDSSGQPLHFITQTQDVSARKNAEIALAETNERLALALRASGLGVWRYQLRTGIAEWDPRTYEILGLGSSTTAPSLDELLERVHEDDRDTVTAAWEKLRSGQPAFRLRFRVGLPDGGSRHVEMQGITHMDPKGAPLWAIGVAGDLTDIVEATMESERLKSQLQQAQKMEGLGNLAAGVAHDFNNLLTGINGFVELASTTLAPSHEANELLRQAQRGALSARVLVRRILNFSRADDERRVVNLVDLAREIAPLLAAALPANVSVSVQAHCEKALILANSGQLQQVLMNLCTNAAHAIGKNPGMIQVLIEHCFVGLTNDAVLPSGCTPGAHARLTVRDNGCGMDAQTCKRIFDRFFTTKKEGEGTGLGLAIVRDIISSYSGGLEVRSELGRGTDFMVYIPLAPGEQLKTSSAPPFGGRTHAELAPRKSSTREPFAAGPVDPSKRILVVDDETSITLVAKFCLQKQGYAAEVFNDSTSGLAAFQRTPGEYLLILVDQNMPGLDGVSFIRTVRLVNAHVPIILMSGRVDFSHEPDFLTRFNVQYILKPFELDELAGAVTQTLAR